MKHLLVFGLMLILLTACGDSNPPYTDNGNPGQIKVIVFFDENENEVMDSGEAGASSHRLALADKVGCASSTGALSFVATDSEGVVIFSDLKPGMYCVAIDNGYQTTTKLNVDAYVSSDEVTTVYFGVVGQ